MSKKSKKQVQVDVSIEAIIGKEVILLRDGFAAEDDFSGYSKGDRAKVIEMAVTEDGAVWRVEFMPIPCTIEDVRFEDLFMVFDPALPPRLHGIPTGSQRQPELLAVVG